MQGSPCEAPSPLAPAFDSSSSFPQSFAMLSNGALNGGSAVEPQVRPVSSTLRAVHWCGLCGCPRHQSHKCRPRLHPRTRARCPACGISHKTRTPYFHPPRRLGTSRPATAPYPPLSSFTFFCPRYGVLTCGCLSWRWHRVDVVASVLLLLSVTECARLWGCTTGREKRRGGWVLACVSCVWGEDAGVSARQTIAALPIAPSNLKPSLPYRGCALLCVCVSWVAYCLASRSQLPRVSRPNPASWTTFAFTTSRSG
jgi:hypothetical protein